ncbi:MAG: FmdB family zinc ribbon protein [Planctomycetota bacterium]
MPVYEYVCRRCAHEFEELVMGGERPACPECRSGDLEKKFSLFAAGGEAGAPEGSFGAGSCGTCGDPRGPGACAP